MSQSIYNFGYRSPRFPANFRVLLQLEDRYPTLLEARCVDISEDGLRAECPSALEVGSIVILIMTLPGSSTSLRIKARVSNRQRDFHGVAFIFSSQKDREHVRDYVEQLRSNSAPSPTPRE